MGPPTQTPGRGPGDPRTRGQALGARGGRGRPSGHLDGTGQRDVRPQGCCPLPSRTVASCGPGARARGRRGASGGLTARTPPEGRPSEMPAPDSHHTALWPENRKRRGRKQARTQAVPRARLGGLGPPLSRRGVPLGPRRTQTRHRPRASPPPSGPWVASRGIRERGLVEGQGGPAPSFPGPGTSLCTGPGGHTAGRPGASTSDHSRGVGLRVFRESFKRFAQFPLPPAQPTPLAMSTLDRYDNCGGR